MNLGLNKITRVFFHYHCHPIRISTYAPTFIPISQSTYTARTIRYLKFPRSKINRRKQKKYQNTCRYTMIYVSRQLFERMVESQQSAMGPTFAFVLQQLIEREKLLLILFFSPEHLLTKASSLMPV